MALVTVGCALASATPPQIEVASVDLREVGLLDQRLQIGLCAFNPNDQELAFRRISVGMDVAGEPLVSGVTESAVTLPPHRSVLVSFDTITTIRNIGPQLAATLSAGAVQYRLHGSVQLSVTLGFTVPFSRSGRLDLLTAGQALLSDQATGAGAIAGCGPASPVLPRTESPTSS